MIVFNPFRKCIRSSRLLPLPLSTFVLTRVERYGSLFPLHEHCSSRVFPPFWSHPPYVSPNQQKFWLLRFPPARFSPLPRTQKIAQLTFSTSSPPFSERIYNFSLNNNNLVSILLLPHSYVPLHIVQLRNIFRFPFSFPSD